MRSPAGLGDQLHVSVHQTLSLLVETRSELVFEPGGAQEANRIVREDARRDRPKNPRLEVAAAAEGIDWLSSGKRDRDRVDREVPGAEIRLDPVRERCEVDRPAVPKGHPPGAVAVGEGEDGTSGEARIGTRGSRRRRACDVDVDDGPPEQLIPHSSTDDVGLFTPDRLEEPLIHRRSASPRARAPSGCRR